MTRNRVLAGLAAIALAAMLGQVVAQTTKRDRKADDPPAGLPEEMIPKPVPEHDLLKKEVGVWDATVETRMGPGSPPSIAKGVETNTLLAGGLWLVTSYKGDLFGRPFEGSGVLGYDRTKKKYVGTWVDSMSANLALSESTYDPAKKTLTGTFEAPDMSGNVITMKSVTEWKDEGTRVFTLSVPESASDEIPAMKITYRRRATAR